MTEEKEAKAYKRLALMILMGMSAAAFLLMVLILFNVLPAANPEEWPLSRRLLNVIVAGAFLGFGVKEMSKP